MTPETLTPEQCLVTYGKAWFERDPAQRLAVLRRCCTDDIVFMDTNLGRLEGVEAVSDMIGQFIGNRPDDGSDSTASETSRSGGGVTVEVVTPIETFHGFFRYSFVWKFPDGRIGPGTDFCEVAADGRMKLITVWPGNEHFPVPYPPVRP